MEERCYICDVKLTQYQLVDNLCDDCMEKFSYYEYDNSPTVEKIHRSKGRKAE